MRRNLTISIDEESYRQAKVVAAQRGQSISTMVRKFFESLSGGGGQGVGHREPAIPASLVDVLGDERLADLELPVPTFTESVQAPDFQ